MTQDCQSTVHLAVKMPTGNRLKAHFRPTDSVKLIYYFIRSQKTCPANFAVSANFPIRSVNVEPTEKEFGATSIERQPRKEFDDPLTFAELGLLRRQVLMVTDEDA